MNLPEPANGFLKSIATNQDFKKGLDAITQNPISKFLFNSSQNVAQDLGVGGALRGEAGDKLYQSQDAARAMAQEAMKKSLTAKDPEERRRLQKVAQDTLATLTGTMQDLSTSFSPDVAKNPIERGMTAGIEVGTGADMLAHPIGTVEGLYGMVRHPIKTLDAITSAAAHPIETLKNLPWNPEESFKLTSSDNGLTKIGNRFLAGQYKGAGKVVQNPSETIGKLADYGLTSPDEVANASAHMTGRDGIANKMVTQAVKKAGAVDTGGIIDNAQSLLDDAELIQPHTEEKILNTVSKSVSKATTPASGVEGGDPEQMLNTLRAWEGKANIKADPNSEAGQIAKVYRGLANDLSQRLFVNSGADNIVTEGLLSPEDYKALSDISPKLAEEVKNAKTIAELRSLQAPFVQGSKMVGIDEKMAGTPISLPETISNATALATGNPMAYALAGAQTRPGMRLAGNTLRALGGLNEGLPQIGVDVIGKSLSNGGLPGQVVADNPANQDNTQNYTNNTHANSISQDVNTPMNYSDIPSDVTKLQPDSNGQYTISSPLTITGRDGQPLAMNESDYTTQKAQLQKDLGTLEVKYNPQLSAQKQAQLEQLETQHDLSAKLQNNYVGAMKVSNAISSASNLLASAPPSLLRDNPTIDKLSKAFDGKYATLAEQLEILKKYYPVMTDSILKSSSPAIAASILSQLGNQNAQDYYQTINGVTGNVPGVKQATGMVAPTPQGLPAIPQNQGQGGWVQAMPANPNMQLAPIGQ